MALQLRKLRYRDAIVSEAIKLARQGYSLRHIESLLPTSFPDEPTPDFRTIGLWLTDADLRESLEPQEIRIAHLTAELFQHELDAVTRGEKSVHPSQAAIMYGIGRTKVFERLNAKSNAAPVTIHVINVIAERRKELRASYKVLPPATDIEAGDTPRNSA